MKRLFAIAWKELRDVGRERTILLALLVQFAVAAFSAFLTVGLVGLYDPESVQGFPPSRVAYVGPGGFDAYLEDAGNLDFRPTTLEDALLQFESGQLAAVIEETYANATGPRTITLLLPDAEIKTTLVVTQLKNLLRDYERDLRVERVDQIKQTLLYVDVDAEPNPFFGFAFSILLPLLLLTPVFMAGAITGDAFTQEISTHTLTLLRASPLTVHELVIGKMLTPVLLVPAQVGLWILLLRANKLHVHNIPLLLVLALSLTLLVASAGVLIAFLVRREGQTQAAYTLFILFLAGLALLLPRDPFNLIARLGVGQTDPTTLGTVGIYGVAAAGLFGIASWVVNHRLRADAV